MAQSDADATPLTVAFLGFSFALAGPLIALAPFGMAPLVIATAIMTMMAERLQGRRWPRPSRISLWLSSLFLAWCAASIAWDINPAAGVRKLFDMALVFASTLSLIDLGGRFSVAQRRRLTWTFIAGAILGLTILGIETIFDFPLYRWAMGNANPRLFGLVEAKRSVDALPLIVWPAALALERIGRPRLGMALAVGFMLASFKLTTSSAMLAMVASVAVLGIAAWSIAAARRLLTAGLVLAFALIIPVAILIYAHGGTTAPWLKRSAQHRVEIWHFAAEKSLDRPLFGHGFNASRFMPNGGAISAFLAPDKPIIPLHPHDAFLQIWLELGLVGVALAIPLSLAPLYGARVWSRDAARFALPCYAAALIIAGLSFGIWQTWWMATLGFSAATCNALARES